MHTNTGAYKVATIALSVLLGIRGVILILCPVLLRLYNQCLCWRLHLAIEAKDVSFASIARCNLLDPLRFIKVKKQA